MLRGRGEGMKTTQLRQGMTKEQEIIATLLNEVIFLRKIIDQMIQAGLVDRFSEEFEEELTRILEVKK
jgi:hypothetical protein